MYTHSLLLANVQWIPPAVFCEFCVKIAVVPLNVMSCDLCTWFVLHCCAVLQVLLWYTSWWQIISRVAVWLRRRWNDNINLDLGKWVVRLKCRPARPHSCWEVDNFINTRLTHPLWVVWVNQPRDPFNSLADLTFKVTRQQITVHMALYPMLYAWILARYKFAHCWCIGSDGATKRTQALCGVVVSGNITPSSVLLLRRIVISLCVCRTATIWTIAFRYCVVFVQFSSPFIFWNLWTT
jgi:hypothetical protein